MLHLKLSKVRFTNQSNRVESDHGIFNPENSIVNTLKGDDTIIGNDFVVGDFGFGVLVGVKAKDLDSTIASAKFSERANITTDGIKNKGIINTGNGSDRIIGTATANISVTAATVSQAIAIAENADATVITEAFASIKFKATVDGIDNCGGQIHTGDGNDGIYGDANGSIAAVATAIAEAVAQAPTSESLTAFAGAMATSLVQAKIIARGINNREGIITTGNGADTINATATSGSATLSDATTYSLASVASNNQALAQSVANAAAQAEDQAIAIDNAEGFINTGTGNDNIFATAQAANKAIAIDNAEGFINTGTGNDNIFATAQAAKKAIAIDNAEGFINTGTGNDNIFAKATGSESYGIFGGNIDMGNGADRVEVSSFGGDIKIKMGKGDDFVQGFGDATMDGGEGCDTLSLGSYNKSDFRIRADNGFTVFELSGTTMKTTGFENYIFADGNFHTL